VRRALRRLSSEVLSDETLAEVVLRNLERVRQMEHPNVLAVHDIFQEDDDDVYVAMDLVHGVNMLEVLARVRETAPLSPSVATFISSQICQALDHARHLRVEGKPASLVHGALSPTNVLLGYRGEVLVTDFGAWVIPTGIHGEVAEYSVRTQFSYRSPEHVNGSTLTSASDIFCVGVLLHEMLTGRQLFLGETLMETLELVENASIDELVGVPPALEPVVRRCLEREPDDRFTDPASLISELSGAVPRAGSREVRNELVSFLEAISRAKGEPLEPTVAPESLAPEPILASDTGSGQADADADEDTRRSRLRLPAPPLDLHPPSVAPLTPLPGLKHDAQPDIDEPTNINPTGVTEALVALSKDATDPGSLDQIFSKDTGEEEEPTRIDPIIPGITGPDGATEEVPTGTAEVPTPIAIPVDQKVLWDSPDENETTPAVVASEDTRPQPVVYPPFPPSAKFVESTTSDDADESTVKTSATKGTLSGEFSTDEEPTFQGLQLESITPPPQQVAVKSSDEEPTVPATPPKDPSPAAQEPPRTGELDDDEPTIQATQPTPQLSDPPPMQKPAVARTLPWPGLEPSEAKPVTAALRPPRQSTEEGTPGIEALARDALHADGEPGEGELEFSYDEAPEPPKPAPLQRVVESGGFRSDNTSEVSTFDRSDQASGSALPVSDVATFSSPGEVQGVGPFNQHGPANPESYVSSLSQFDSDSSVYSISMDRPRPRFTAAHVLLLVAIVVFLVAVGLLVRRLVLQSRHRPRAAVQLVVDASAGPQTTSLAPDGGGTSAPAPAPAPKTKTKTKTKTRARTKTETETGTKAKAPVHSSGQHLTELLQGKLKPGMLRVSTDPSATLYINGKRVGVTPLTKRVRPGDSIKLAMVAKKYEVHRQDLDIPFGGGVNLEIKLREATYPRAEGKRRGWLVVHCKKRDRRRIELNDRDTGFNCPGPVIFRLKPGRYKVGFTVVATGKTRSRRARVRRGKRVRVWAPRR
jgi:serine/threonine-protein kinase